MGRLARYNYLKILRQLKKQGFEFHQQAAGNHEIWYSFSLKLYTTIPNHSADMPEGTLR